jgi:hypothetical protein
MTPNTDRERRAIEAGMDEMLAESFPASDPPVWGSAAARLRQLEAIEAASARRPKGRDELSAPVS